MTIVVWFFFANVGNIFKADFSFAKPFYLSHLKFICLDVDLDCSVLFLGLGQLLILKEIPKFFIWTNLIDIYQKNSTNKKALIWDSTSAF